MSIYLLSEEDTEIFASLKTFKVDPSSLEPIIESYTKESHPFYGQKHTEETLLAMSASHMGSRNSMYGLRGKDNPNYGRTREDLVAINKQRAGRTLSEETKKKLSDGRTGDKNWNYGKPRNPETLEKMSKAVTGINNPRYGKPGTMLGKTQPKVVCPHCKKDGGISNMKRFHFDLCKNKDNK
jgi:hypothetical protein